MGILSWLRRQVRPARDGSQQGAERNEPAPPSAAELLAEANPDELDFSTVIASEPRSPAGTWAPTVNAWTHAPGRQGWPAIVAHARTATGSTPTQRWLRTATPLLDALGSDAFVAGFRELVATAPLGETAPTSRWFSSTQAPIITDDEQDLLKGLVWMAELAPATELSGELADLAIRSLRKIPEHGAASTRVANACVNTLGRLPDGAGVAQLSRLLGHVRLPSARQRIDRALETAARSSGQSRADLEEIAMPTFGLDANDTARKSIGDFEAELTVEKGEAVLRWITGKGKRQKSIPKAVKDGHPEELRALQRQHKDLKNLLAAQPARLERMWIDERRRSVADLRMRYLQHPIVGPCARRLVWRVEGEAGPQDVLWRDEELRGLGGAKVMLADDDQARLLHLIDLQDRDEEVLVWRDYLDEQGITQPFPQLWREVYRPESAERDVCERFAGHIVRQQPLRSLCRERGWRYDLQGRWDSLNHPFRVFRDHGVVVTFAVDPIDHATDDAVYQYLFTGAVYFSPVQDERYAANQRLPLADVPALILSEALRDVDLFVARGTVANDPDFDRRGIRDVYSDDWPQVAWTPLSGVSDTRRRVLEHILPRTTLRDCARVDGDSLVVAGPAGTFRLHIGSGQAFRDGEARPLRVVLGRSAKTRVQRVFLPFEGDGVLTDLLAKAFELASAESV